MKKLGAVIIIGLMLSGCGNETKTQTQAEIPVAQATAPAIVRNHNYSLKDGLSYGYERMVTVDETNNGQAASSLLMAKFAGKREGKYQVFMDDDQSTDTFIVIECTASCDFLKSMLFYQGQYVRSERIRAAPGTIGWMMLEDAINGDLEQYESEDGGKKYSIWFDEKKGIIEQPVSSLNAAK
jgi:hypothetical protein